MSTNAVVTPRRVGQARALDIIVAWIADRRLRIVPGSFRDRDGVRIGRSRIFMPTGAWPFRFGGTMDALGIPPAALRDANALELARVWIAEQGLHCSLKVGLYAGDGVSTERRRPGVSFWPTSRGISWMRSAPRAWDPKRISWMRLSRVSTTRWPRRRPDGQADGARRWADTPRK